MALIGILGLLANNGYNESDINDNYTSTYALTIGLRAEWIFTSSAFNESAGPVMNIISIPSDPTDYKKILDDYPGNRNWKN